MILDWVLGGVVVVGWVLAAYVAWTRTPADSAARKRARHEL